MCQRETSAGFAGSQNPAHPDPTIIDFESNRVLDYLNPDRDGPRPNIVKAKLQKIMNDYVGVVRNDEGLRGAITSLERMEAEDLKSMSVADPSRIGNYDWIEALEVTAMVRFARAMAGAALKRTESRGAHYREDYPDLDNTNWLKNIVIRKAGDGLQFDLQTRAPDPALELAE